MNQESWREPVTRLAARLAQGELSPEDLLDGCLARIRRLDPQINAIVALDEAAARKAAGEAAARLRSGRRLSPLDGIPVTVKDNLHCTGFPATWGSRLYRDFRPAKDDVFAARLRAAGAVIVGKTNTPEFALASHTDNLVFGPTRNPWNPALTPGGSSGGAVAAIAAGLVPLAVGTDAGGSIRRPASYAGVVGLRPSNGRIPRVRGFPALAGDFQAIAPAARTIGDLHLLLRVLAGPDPADVTSLAFAHAPLPETLPAAPDRPLRILHASGIEGIALDEPVAAALDAAAAALAALGHTVEPGPVPYDLALVEEVWATLSTTGLARVIAAHADAPALATPAALAMAERGAALPATRYVLALDGVARLRAGFRERMAGYDVLLTPASPSLPWPIGIPNPETIGGRKAGARDAAAFSTFLNALGCPGLSVPAGFSPDGLPIGMQLVGRHGDEPLLLALAHQYERQHDWHDRWPALAG